MADQLISTFHCLLERSISISFKFVANAQLKIDSLWAVRCHSVPSTEYAKDDFPQKT